MHVWVVCASVCVGGGGGGRGEEVCVCEGSRVQVELQ